MADNSERGENVEEKVLRYEGFIDNRLRTDLEAVYKAQQVVYGKINEHVQLKTSILQVQKNNGPMKTMVEVGSNCYCQAKLPHTSMIFVAAGFGFYVQLTFDEALTFIDKKCSLLNASAEKLTQQVAQIKAHMKMVLGGLQELQHLQKYD